MRRSDDKDVRWEERVRQEYGSMRKSGHLKENEYPPVITRGQPAPSWLTDKQKVAWETARTWYFEIEARCPGYYGDL